MSYLSQRTSVEFNYNESSLLHEDLPLKKAMARGSSINSANVGLSEFELEIVRAEVTTNEFNADD